MKSLSSTIQTHNSNDLPTKKQIHSFYRTAATIDVVDPIRQKINTFTHWNLSSSLPRERHKSMRKNALIRNNTNDAFKLIIEALAGKAGDGEDGEKDGGHGKKKEGKFQELEGIKTERRQRFKHIQNTQFIVNYYKQKQGYTPNTEQSLLLDTLIFLKQKIDSLQPFDLNLAIQYITKIMNVTVDVNQMKFFLLSVMMAGQICYQSKELKSSFFFFAQAIIAANCTEAWATKLRAMIFLGRICIDALEYEKAIIFFKKSLQYAWKIKDGETELRIYDLIGQCHYYLGNAESAQYYHNRYILGQNAKNESAVKRMSAEMLNEFLKTIDNSEHQNLSELFLSYLRLPISNFKSHPPVQTQKVYENYTDGVSPRKFVKSRSFDFHQLPDVSTQVNKILKEWKEFNTEIPNPDLYRNFVVTQKYGKLRKQIGFQQSHDYHKITGIKIKDFDKSILKFPTDEKVTKILQQKSNPHWWEDIVTQVKKERSQKLGNIRNRTFKRHLSFNDNDRKRIQSLKKEKIHETFNKTVLNWIDPPKKGQF